MSLKSDFWEINRNKVPSWAGKRVKTNLIC